MLQLLRSIDNRMSGTTQGNVIIRNPDLDVNGSGNVNGFDGMIANNDNEMENVELSSDDNQIRRVDDIVNMWNQVMSVGLEAVNEISAGIKIGSNNVEEANEVVGEGLVIAREGTAVTNIEERGNEVIEEGLLTAGESITEDNVEEKANEVIEKRVC